jgi:hypothetical protein
MMDQIYYEITVEANTEDEANEIALNSVEEAEVISNSLVEVVETEEI